jgi:hypothetical protein
MIYVHDTSELDDLIARLSSLDGILSVERYDAEDKNNDQVVTARK